MRMQLQFGFGGLLMAAFACAGSQQDALLDRIRQHMAESLARQPNYTCLETVERTQQVTGGGPMVQDTLRLEVALVDGKEMFAWPGSRQFEDKSIRDLITTGMFGNGNFATYARIVFQSWAPTFSEGPGATVEARSAVRYDFRVARRDSGNHLRVGEKEADVGFHGFFDADPVTLDPIRLQIIDDDIPADLGLTAAENSVTYGRRKIGEQEFLLPVESSLMMADPKIVHRNHVTFSSCRQFTGESVLYFDDPLPDTDAQVAAAVQEVIFPPDQQLVLELGEIDLRAGAAGDPVEAVLNADVKYQKKLLAPKGAIAHGRIMELLHSGNQLLLRIDFQDLDWPQGHAHLNLTFDHAWPQALGLIRVEPNGDILLRSPAPRHLIRALTYWRTLQ